MFVACKTHFAFKLSRKGEHANSVEVHIPEVIMPWPSVQRNPVSEATVQSWLDEYIYTKANHACNSTPLVCPGAECEVNGAFTVECDDVAHLFLHFELPQMLKISASTAITIPGSGYVYDLVGIVYHGSNHFTARILGGNTVYEYDGQVNGGIPILRASSDGNQCYGELEGRTAHICIYRLRIQADVESLDI